MPDLRIHIEGNDYLQGSLKQNNVEVRQWVYNDDGDAREFEEKPNPKTFSNWLNG